MRTRLVLALCAALAGPALAQTTPANQAVADAEAARAQLVHEKGFSANPSDQANFPYGVGICALRKKGKTLYLSRIHTPKDTILEETNVNILRAALITFITCGAAQ